MSGGEFSNSNLLSMRITSQIYSTYRCLLDDNVLDDQVLEVKVLRIGVRLGVLQEAEHELERLLGPST